MGEITESELFKLAVDLFGQYDALQCREVAQKLAEIYKKEPK